MTVEELIAELGVTVDPAKAGVLKTWNDKFSAMETDSQTKLADAQKQLQDAQGLQRVIDDSIRESGLTEANIAQLQANNAALTAALSARDAAIDEIKKAGLYRELWQSFAVIPAVRTVGVMGDGRTYAYPIIIRAVTSDDAMTADWARLPYDVIESIANRLIREVEGVNRVALDVTSKPPGTIEWE